MGKKNRKGVLQFFFFKLPYLLITHAKLKKDKKPARLYMVYQGRRRHTPM